MESEFQGIANIKLNKSKSPYFKHNDVAQGFQRRNSNNVLEEKKNVQPEMFLSGIFGGHLCGIIDGQFKRGSTCLGLKVTGVIKVALASQCHFSSLSSRILTGLTRQDIRRAMQ